MTDLLALSDVLVVRALERAYSRGLTGEYRRATHDRQLPRHRAYEQIHIPPSRHARALDDAWSLTDELAASWDLPIASPVWARSLDDYCRSLLTTQRPRSLPELEAILAGAGVTRAS